VSEVLSAVAVEREMVGREADGENARALLCSWAASREADAVRYPGGELTALGDDEKNWATLAAALREDGEDRVRGMSFTGIGTAGDVEENGLRGILSRIEERREGRNWATSIS